MSDLTSDEGPLSGARILIVEDDPIQAIDIHDALSRSGAAEVASAANLEEAAQMLGSGTFDAAILDLRIGERNATTFARHLIQQEIPFLIHTGYPDSAFFNLNWPGCKLLAKPADMGTLVTMAADLLTWRRNRREANASTSAVSSGKPDATLCAAPPCAHL